MTVRPTGYPEEYETDAVLADGGTVHIRPIVPQDGDGYRSLHARLSPSSVYYRYFSAKSRLSDKDIAHFTTVDYDQRLAVVAVLGGELIGVARYDRHEDHPHSAEVAFDVDDAHHGRGVATLLLEVLAVAAQARGIDTFTASVLRENAKMLSVFRAAGWVVSREYDSGVVELSFPIAPTDASEAARLERERLADLRSVRPLMEPESIAVIGASPTPGSLGLAVVESLVSHGYPGAVHPVHPLARSIGSLVAYPSMADIPGDVDVAVVCTPAASVPGIVEECAAKKVRALIIMSGGFDGVHALRAEDLAVLVRGRGMRLLGPGSSGIYRRAGDRVISLTNLPIMPLPGAAALSVHAGLLAGALVALANDHGVGLSSVVSTGARVDVTGRDLLSFWEHDPYTRVICMHLPGLAYPRKFGRVTRRVARTKPVIVTGTGDVGTHPMTNALFHQAGVIHVDQPSELFDTARVLLDQPLPAGRRVVLVSNAFGVAELAQSALGPADLVLAELDEATQARVVAAGARSSRPVVALSAFATVSEVTAVIAAVLDAPAVDAVVLGLAAPAGVTPGELAQAVQDIVARTPRSTTIVASVGGLGDGVLIDGDPACRIPSFAFPETAVKALGRAAEYGSWVHRDPGSVPVGTVTRTDEMAAMLRAALDEMAPGEAGVPLGFERGGELLGQAGIMAATTSEVASVDEAIAAAEAIGFPVCLKVVQQRIGLGEAGGIALDLHSAADVRGAWGRMIDDVSEKPAGPVVMQSMVTPGPHVRVALEQHALFGSVLSLSAGGSMAESLHERSLWLLPLTDADARDLVASARVRVLLSDVQVEHVEQLVLRIAALAEVAPEIDALVVNPVLITPDGPVAVGWRVHVSEPTPDLESFRRVV